MFSLSWFGHQHDVYSRPLLPCIMNSTWIYSPFCHPFADLLIPFLLLTCLEFFVLHIHPLLIFCFVFMNIDCLTMPSGWPHCPYLASTVISFVSKSIETDIDVEIQPYQTDHVTDMPGESQVTSLLHLHLHLHLLFPIPRLLSPTTPCLQHDRMHGGTGMASLDTDNERDMTGLRWPFDDHEEDGA